MKLIIFSCLIAVALCAPQNNPDRDAQVIRDDRTAPDAAGYFRNELEVDNGIYSQSEGEPGIEGQTNMRGSYRLPLPDGGFAIVNWVADENGFRAESPILPQ